MRTPCCATFTRYITDYNQTCVYVYLSSRDSIEGCRQPVRAPIGSRASFRENVSLANLLIGRRDPITGFTRFSQARHCGGADNVQQSSLHAPVRSFVISILSVEMPRESGNPRCLQKPAVSQRASILWSEASRSYRKSSFSVRWWKREDPRNAVGFFLYLQKIME